MQARPRIKICGLREAAHIDAAVEAGAAYVGFVFFEKSPRHVSLSQAAKLAYDVRPGVCKVALTVNASDSDLQAILDQVPLDMLQLHGQEPPDRVLDIKAKFGLPVMKAIGVAGAEDLPALDNYSAVADQILVDTKAPKGADLPGGNGITFDWGIIAGRRWSVPWMLAGGLNAGNVKQAMRQTGAQQLDLSSAVETAPGIKDPDLIRDFIKAAS